MQYATNSVPIEPVLMLEQQPTIAKNRAEGHDEKRSSTYNPNWNVVNDLKKSYSECPENTSRQTNLYVTSDNLSINFYSI